MSWDRALQLGLLLVSCVAVMAGNLKTPGVRSTFTQSGLDYGAKVFSRMIQRNVDNIRIPASSGQIASPIGTVEYYTKNMELTDFDMGHSRLGVVPEVGVRMSISVDSAGVKGDWGYQLKSLFPMTDSGSFDVTVEAAYIDVVINIMRHKSGRPTASLSSCDADIGNMDLIFHGGASWLYNLFSPIIVQQLKTELDEMLCDAVNKSVHQKMDGGMASTPVIVPMVGDIFLDMRLVNDVVFGIGYLQTLVKGTARQNGTNPDAALQPRDLPNTNYTGAPRMVYYDVTEHFFKSIGQVFYQSGMLSAIIKASDVPVNSPIQLKPSDKVIGTVLPKVKPFTHSLFLDLSIQDKYPDATLQVHLNASAPPKVSITEKGAVFSLAGRAVTFASDREGKLDRLFGVKVAMEVPVSFSMSGINLVANASESSARVEIKPLKSSKVGEIGPDAQKLIELYLCRQAVIPWFNRYLQVGVPFKLNKVKYINPEVLLHKNYLTIETDIVIMSKSGGHVTSPGMRTEKSSSPSPPHTTHKKFTRLQTHHTPS
ncbi:bactericidal permeability-increasing protein-like [Branchiostoma floridae]|uniref:Bactericidal permeability-increasing protein-like n=1 Tax=Branchiostoma floridae TaxID=7739 RepID=A0A9J7MU86_BRAFL|nr:bactericidal permeability-increasing protein-like [Branchiostoma floridae]